MFACSTGINRDDLGSVSTPDSLNAVGSGGSDVLSGYCSICVCVFIYTCLSVLILVTPHVQGQVVGA